jgi:hypothetical protein
MLLEQVGDSVRWRRAGEFDSILQIQRRRQLLERRALRATTDNRQRWSDPAFGQSTQRPEQQIATFVGNETAEKYQVSSAGHVTVRLKQ